MARPRSDKLVLRHIGPIRKVEIDLGDLTLLVGAQGTGKSIALQLFKLTQDRYAIAKTARDNGLVWSDRAEFLDAYLGAGLRASWSKESLLQWKGKPVTVPPQNRAARHAKVFYVPAQRALTIENDWPRAFSSYSNAPFVVREFGLQLQQMLLRNRAERIFPSKARLKADVRKALDEAIFHTGTLELRQESHQQRLKIIHGKAELPYMAWSAGQREFAPLLLALYELLPGSAKSKHDHVDWVIIEEPEMGLHPQAILATCALLMDLLHRNYRVILSTHHPLVLDVVWLIRELQASAAAKPKDLLSALGLPARVDMTNMAKSVLDKEFRVFVLNHASGGVISNDISSLDPCSDDAATAGWGGLTGLSARVQDIVADVMARNG